VSDYHEKCGGMVVSVASLAKSYGSLFVCVDPFRSTGICLDRYIRTKEVYDTMQSGIRKPSEQQVAKLICGSASVVTEG